MATFQLEKCKVRGQTIYLLEIFYSPKPDIWDQKGIKNDIRQFHFSFHKHFNNLTNKFFFACKAQNFASRQLGRTVYMGKPAHLRIWKRNSIFVWKTGIWQDLA